VQRHGDELVVAAARAGREQEVDGVGLGELGCRAETAALRVIQAGERPADGIRARSEVVDRGGGGEASPSAWAVW
jgi:hypothetical protein